MDTGSPYLFVEGLAAFVVGACIGSFLNVCVYRIPLNRSVIHPGSHCAACGAPIPWYYNLPILSWFILRGRAACCGTRIDKRYWMVELGMGVIFLALWLRYPPIEAVLYAIMVAGITAACLIDLDHYIIPDRFTLGGCVAGFIACSIHPALMGQKTALMGFSWSLAAAIIGAIFLLAVAWLGTILFKKEAMGMGDVKFLAAMCSFLGASSIVWILPVSSLIGSGLGLALIVWQRGAWGTRIPYGPFLGLAALLWLFGGRELYEAWWNNTVHVWSISNSPQIDSHSIPGP
jgi:leader peptidase (prepilin peptidase)/N-methyltransferase